MSQRYTPNNVTLKKRNCLHFITAASLRLGTGNKRYSINWPGYTYFCEEFLGVFLFLDWCSWTYVHECSNCTVHAFAPSAIATRAKCNRKNVLKLLSLVISVESFSYPELRSSWPAPRIESSGRHQLKGLFWLADEHTKESNRRWYDSKHGRWQWHTNKALLEP